MQKVLNDLKTVIELGILADLCLVTGTTSSTPRKAGSKMLVVSSGSNKGRIVGGSIEY